MPLPTLVVVSGPPGAGKTTLAHTLAAAVGCPAICRDEIKEGMVRAGAAPGREADLRTLTTFFDVLGVLLGGGVTVVAEAAFQDRLWRPGLEPLRDRCEMRIIRCLVGADVAYERVARRLADDPRRAAAHGDGRHLRERTAGTDGFGWITLSAPTLDVDTGDGYHPALRRVVAFVEGG